MPINSALSEDGSELLIKINGNLNYQLGSRFSDIYMAYADNPAISSYIIDLNASDVIDSSLLGVLLLMHTKLSDTVTIRIKNCSPHVRKILLMSRFDTMFTIE